MSARASSFALLLPLALTLACAPIEPSPDAGGGPSDAGGSLEDAGPPDTGYPAPRSDLVERVGSDTALDMATWNIENFPAQASTPSLVADLVTSLDLDLVAVEEIADTEAFNELVARLPRHHGIYSSHTYSSGEYQKVGFLYREDLLTPSDVRLLFPGSGGPFPRPPLQATFTLDDGVHAPVDLIVIALHLKAGRANEDAQRRSEALVLLESHVRDLVDGPADDEVLILGDFNEVLDEAGGRAVFSPFLNAPQRYRVHTDALAQQGAETFLPAQIMLDHIVTTVALDDEIAGRVPVIPRLDGQMAGYETLVSDHLPVVISLPVLQ